MVFRTGRNHKKEQGAALIMALLLMLVASIIVAGLAIDSDLDLRIARNLQLKNQALNNAETGIALASKILRRAVMDRFKNELAAEEPGMISVGHYQLQLYKNLQDIYTQGGKAEVFREGVKLASVNIVSRKHPDRDARSFELDAVGREKTAEQKVVVVMKEKDSSMQLKSPFCLFNGSPGLTFRDSSFVSGRNYSVPEDFMCAGAGCSPQDYYSSGGAKSPIYFHEHVEKENIVLEDDSAVIDGYSYDRLVELIGRSTLDGADWEKKSEFYAYLADNEYPGDIPGTLGTREQPEINVIKGTDVEDVNGSGILILKNGARITGNMHFEGLLMVKADAGQDFVLFSGGNNTIYGAVVVLGEEVPVILEGSPHVELSSTPSIVFSREGLIAAMIAINKDAPLERLAWRTGF